MVETKYFNEAEVGEEAYVYVCEPGSEHGWVVDPEWWDDIDDPVTTKRQRWRLVDEVDVTFHPSHEMCPECSGDEYVENPHYCCPEDEPPSIQCPTCRDDPGAHPLAGQMEVRIPDGPVPQVGERAGDQRTSVGKRSVDVRRFSDRSYCGRLLTEWDQEPTGLTDYEATLRVVGNPGVQVTVSQWEGCRRRCSDLRAAGYIIDSGVERDGHIIWHVSPLGREAARSLRMTGWTKGAPS